MTIPGALIRSSVMIHIGRAGTNLGSFSEEEVRQGLTTGRFSLNDLGWKEGMANWAPLSQFSEFTAPAAPMPPLPEDESPDQAGVTESADAAEPGGLPWDHRKERGSLAAFTETARLVLTNPSVAFARMQAEGGLFDPILYNLIGGWLGLLASGIYAILTSRMQPPPSDQEARFYLSPAMAMTALKMFIWLGPIIVTVNTLIFSVIAHLFLMLTGGANKPFHVTLRVFCFSYGSTQLLQMLPFCGSPLALLWMVVCGVVGLALAHGTTTGRSMAAMVLFIAACCICCMGIFILAGVANYDSLRPMLNR